MFAISPTDINWFKYLRSTGFSSEINFWTPTPWNVSRLSEGDKLYFMLKSPIRKLGGFGEFSEYKNLSAEAAWNEYGYKNGCTSKYELIERLDKYKQKNSIDDASILESTIGCIVLDNVQFWDDDSFLDPSDYGVSFPREVVKIKYFNETDPFSTRFIREDETFYLVNNDNNEHPKTLTKQRIGQSYFKSIVSKAYSNTCCITEEDIPELLEAAHIQPYINENSNHVQNGILLRVDLHKLFDNGLLYIDEDYKVHISQYINSPNYKKYDGQKIYLPKEFANWPSKEALRLKKYEFRTTSA